MGDVANIMLVILTSHDLFLVPGLNRVDLRTQANFSIPLSVNSNSGSSSQQAIVLGTVLPWTPIGFADKYTIPGKHHRGLPRHNVVEFYKRRSQRMLEPPDPGVVNHTHILLG